MEGMQGISFDGKELPVFFYLDPKDVYRDRDTLLKLKSGKALPEGLVSAKEKKDLSRFSAALEQLLSEETVYQNTMLYITARSMARLTSLLNTKEVDEETFEQMSAVVSARLKVASISIKKAKEFIRSNAPEEMTFDQVFETIRTLRAKRPEGKRAFAGLFKRLKF